MCLSPRTHALTKEKAEGSQKAAFSVNSYAYKNKSEVEEKWDVRFTWINIS